MSTVMHVSEQNRFVAEEGGQKAGYLEYTREADGSIFVVEHVVTDEAFRGRGIAGELTAAAFEHARRHNVQVRPVCPYVKEWVQRHPQVQDLLA